MSRRTLSRALTLALLATAAPATAAHATIITGSDGCDRLDPAACLLPFPNDAFTRPDRSTPTGRTLDLRTYQTPTNDKHKPIDMSGWKGLDGFSPGSVILTKVAALQTDAALGKTRAVSLSDLSQYTNKTAPVLVLDAKTGRRWPIWAELDANAKAGRRLLEIHPARNFLEATATSSSCGPSSAPTAARSAPGRPSPSCATAAARSAPATGASSPRS